MIVGTAQDAIGRMAQEEEADSSRAASRFEEQYVEHYPRVFLVLFRLLGDRSQAEELANDVFWRLYRQRLIPTNADGNVGGWLYRTATNLGIDALRAAARRREYEHAAGELRVQAGAQAGLADPLNDLLRAEKRSRVRAVLARLKPAQSEILILRASGFSYKELAVTLGVAGGSVGTMLARAEAAFAACYVEAYGREEEI